MLAGASALALCCVTSAHATPLTLWAAGSLNPALATVASNFTAATGVAVTTTFQPSGTIAMEIEAGARPDLFASADTGNPLALQQAGLAGPVVNFASNSLVAVVAPGYNVTSANLISSLLNPAITLGTSTPVYDPLGDYTEQLFSEIDATDPGAKAILDAKAERLIAGPTSPPVPAGDNALVYFLDTTHQADIFIAYASSAPAALAIDPALTEVALPADLAIAAEYGMTIINGADPGTVALENYILSPAGQAVLASDGFGPPTTVPEPAGLALVATAVVGLIAAKRRRAGGLNVSIN